ncbi:MAG: DUF3575 domain-containing protein [Saprospiraceae bacterium]
MKSTTILFCAISLLSVSFASAQIEIKTNPVALLFEFIPVAAEFPIRNDMSLEAEVNYYPNEFFYAGGVYRYYFKPSAKLNDRFFLCALVGASDFGVGPGFGLGYKWVSRRNILLDLGIGIGRYFGNEVDDQEAFPWGRLHIGYRFHPRN